IHEQPGRGGDSVVEITIAGAGRQGPFQRVEHREQRPQRRAPPLGAGGLPLAGRPPTEVVELGEETQPTVALLVELVPELFDFVDRFGAQLAFYRCWSLVSSNSASTTSPSPWAPPPGAAAPGCGPPDARASREAAWASVWATRVRLSWARRIRS